jgi:hypothetical protein
MLKLNKLFLYEDRSQSFSSQIEPLPHQRRFLTECRNKIRDCLRDGIKQASKTVLGMEKMIEPRFRTQGSWSYGACIRQAHVPPQQMDWDYGVYLPAMFWARHKPKVAAKAYFDLVERLLEGLCRDNGWKLLKGDECKDTCIRIEVDYWAHIDIPLYAAPEEKFRQITERVALNFRKSTTFDGLDERDETELEEESFDWQDLEEIMMATRDGEWKESDPGAVSQWFDYLVDVHGNQLRRICRYVKAWRDYHWRDGGGPSSILLMILVARGIAANPRRDDLVLEEAAARIAEGLRQDVYELGIGDGKENFNSLKPTERLRAAEKAAALRAALRQARSRAYFERSVSISDLREQLGDRIPYELDWVEQEAGAADTVRATAPAYVASPKVKSTSAG